MAAASDGAVDSAAAPRPASPEADVPPALVIVESPRRDPADGDASDAAAGVDVASIVPLIRQLSQEVRDLRRSVDLARQERKAPPALLVRQSSMARIGMTRRRSMKDQSRRLLPDDTPSPRPSNSPSSQSDTDAFKNSGSAPPTPAPRAEAQSAAETRESVEGPRSWLPALSVEPPPGELIALGGGGGGDGGGGDVDGGSVAQPARDEKGHASDESARGRDTGERAPAATERRDGDEQATAASASASDESQERVVERAQSDSATSGSTTRFRGIFKGMVALVGLQSRRRSQAKGGASSAATVAAVAAAGASAAAAASSTAASASAPAASDGDEAELQRGALSRSQSQASLSSARRQALSPRLLKSISEESLGSRSRDAHPSAAAAASAAEGRSGDEGEAPRAALDRRPSGSQSAAESAAPAGVADEAAPSPASSSAPSPGAAAPAGAVSSSPPSHAGSSPPTQPAAATPEPPAASRAAADSAAAASAAAVAAASESWLAQQLTRGVGGFLFRPRFRSWWRLWMAVTIFYNCLFVPLRIAFADLYGWNYSFDRVADLSYGLDALLRLADAYLGSQSPLKRVVSAAGAEADTDSRLLLPLALASALPVEATVLWARWLFGDAWFTEEMLHSARVLPLVRLVRVLRLPQLYGTLMVWEAMNLRHLYISPTVVKLIKLAASLLLSAHVVGCCYLFISFWEGFPEENEWVVPAQIREASSPLLLYTHVIYWGFSSMTGIGEGVGRPHTMAEHLFTVAVLLLGVTMYATLVGNLSHIIQNLHTKTENYLEKMESINAFCETNDVPMELRDRLRNCFEYLHHQDLLEDKWEVLSLVPQYLRNEVMYALFAPIVRNVRMFKFCEEGFIRSLVILLKPQICLPGDWLIRQGEVGREMYLIVRGTMHVIANGTVVATISDGSYVGEVAVLYEQKRIASVRAATYCHLLLLSKEDIDSVVDHYPNVLQQFETEAKLYPSIQKMLRERHKKLRERASEGNAALRQLAAHGSPQLTVRRPSNAAAAAAAAAAGVSDPSHSPVPAAAPPPERRVLRRSETNAYAPPQRSATAAAAAGTSVAAAGEGVYSIAKPASPRLKSPLHGRTDISRTLRRANTAFVASDASASEPSEPLRGPNIAEDDEDDSDEAEAATAPRHARTESGPAALDRENQRAALRRREQRSAQPQ